MSTDVAFKFIFEDSWQKSEESPPQEWFVGE